MRTGGGINIAWWDFTFIQSEMNSSECFSDLMVRLGLPVRLQLPSAALRTARLRGALSISY